MALPFASWVDRRNVGSAIDERFDQPNFKARKNLESVLVDFLNDDDFCSQIKVNKRKLCRRHQVLLSSSPVGDIQGSDEGQTDRKFSRYFKVNEVKRQKSLA